MRPELAAELFFDGEFGLAVDTREGARNMRFEPDRVDQRQASCSVTPPAASNRTKRSLVFPWHRNPCGARCSTLRGLARKRGLLAIRTNSADPGMFCLASYAAELVAGMSTNGKDKSRRIRIRCSAANESGACLDPKTFYLETVERAVFSGLKVEMRHPEVIAEYVRTYHEERKKLAADAEAKRGTPTPTGRIESRA